MKTILLFVCLLAGSLIVSGQCYLPSGTGCGSGPLLTGDIIVSGNTNQSGGVTLPGTYGGVTYTGFTGTVVISIGQNSTLNLEDGFIIAQGTTVSIGETNGNPIVLAGGTEYRKNSDPGFVALSTQLSGCTTPGGCTVGAILPIELLEWKAAVSDKQSAVILSWATAWETDNEAFIVEHSHDGLSFLPLTEIAGNVTAVERQAYSYRHEPLSGGDHYYRLAQRDFDGTTTRFGILRVTLREGDTGLRAYPNPVAAGAVLRFNAQPSAGTDAVLYNSVGRAIAFTASDAARNNGTLRLPAHLEAGLYLLRSGGSTVKVLVR